MKLNFRTQLFVPTVSALILMVIITVIVYVSTNSLLRNMTWVQHTYEVIADGKQLLANMVDQETGMRGFAVTGDDEFLEPYNNGKESFDKNINELKQTVNDNPAQVSRLNQIESTAKEWRNSIAEKYIELRKEIRAGEAQREKLFNLIESGVGKREMDNIRRLISTSGMPENAQNVIVMKMVNMETGLRGFLLNNKEEYLEPYYQSKKTIVSDLYELGASRNIEAAVNNWIEEYAEEAIKINMAAIEYPDLDKLYAEFEKKEGKKYMDQIRTELDTFSSTEDNLLVQRNKDAEGNAALTKLLLIALTIAAILISVTILIYIIRGIMKQLGGEPNEVATIAQKIGAGDLTISTDDISGKTGVVKDMYLMINKLRQIVSDIFEGSDNIVSASQQMAGTSQQMSQSTNEQASAVEEVSSSLE
jgi:methyl-accepting chemotaxis protein